MISAIKRSSGTHASSAQNSRRRAMPWILRGVLSALCYVNAFTGLMAQQPPASGTVQRTPVDAPGTVRILSLNSPHQRLPTRVHVVLPESAASKHEESSRHLFPVLCFLPVEAQDGNRWGSLIEELHQFRIADRHQVICVYPEFADLPWYANHPDNPQLQQEKYLLEDVIPLLESEFPVRRDQAGRFLIGFSKSGWGAWSLLLRHPDLFHQAVAFDAPLMMDAPGKYGSGPMFGTTENFRMYQVSELLRQHQAEVSRQPPRLILIGDGNFRLEHQQIAALAAELQIPLLNVSGQVREHSWQSGWVSPAVELLQLPPGLVTVDNP
ncbi:MAG: hypothetical protein KDA85_14730 [Planctomycetaceae bacterium]|nr:hypothetical protein [Planctomycetaceae bacterium]